MDSPQKLVSNVSTRALTLLRFRDAKKDGLCVTFTHACAELCRFYTTTSITWSAAVAAIFRTGGMNADKPRFMHIPKQAWYVRPTSSKKTCEPAWHTVASPIPLSLPLPRRRLPPVLCHLKEEFAGQWLQFRALNCESGLSPFIRQLLVHRAHILCAYSGANSDFHTCIDTRHQIMFFLAPYPDLHGRSLSPCSATS